MKRGRSAKEKRRKRRRRENGRGRRSSAGTRPKDSDPDLIHTTEERFPHRFFPVPVPAPSLALVWKEAGAGMGRLERWEARGLCSQCVFQHSPGWGKGTLLPALVNTTRQEQPWLDVTGWVDQGSITQAYARAHVHARECGFPAIMGCSERYRRGHSSS